MVPLSKLRVKYCLSAQQGGSMPIVLVTASKPMILKGVDTDKYTLDELIDMVKADITEMGLPQTVSLSGVFKGAGDDEFTLALKSPEFPRGERVEMHIYQEYVIVGSEMTPVLINAKFIYDNGDYVKLYYPDITTDA